MNLIGIPTQHVLAREGLGLFPDRVANGDALQAREDALRGHCLTIMGAYRRIITGPPEYLRSSSFSRGDVQVRAGARHALRPACATASTTATASRDTHEGLNGVLWVQTSAEFWALTTATYNSAQVLLENALSLDKSWSAASSSRRVPRLCRRR